MADLNLSFSPIVCCIYHKPKAFDESSSEESGSDSDSDSDSGDDGRARPANRRRHHHHHHEDGDDHHSQAMRDGDGGGVVHELESDDSDVNMYERQPKKPNKGKAPQRS